jgi:hypothetical protein
LQGADENTLPGHRRLDRAQESALSVLFERRRCEEPFIFSETNQYQTIQWLETHDNVTIIYSLGSESIGVTKEQLLAIAASMSE